LAKGREAVTPLLSVTVMVGRRNVRRRSIWPLGTESQSRWPFILASPNVKTISLRRDSWIRCEAFAFASRHQREFLTVAPMHRGWILCDQFDAQTVISKRRRLRLIPEKIDWAPHS